MKNNNKNNRLDRIERGIEELLKSQKLTDEQLKKTDEQLKRTDEEIKATAAKTDEQLRKTDEEIKAADAKTDEQLRKTDEEIKALTRKTDKQLEKTDAEIGKVNKLVAGVTDGWGRLTEGLAISSVEQIFREESIDIIDISVRRKRRMNGKEMEIDLLNIAHKGKKEVIIIVENKTYLTAEKVKAFIENIGDFYDFFDEYRDKEIIGAMCYMNAGKGVREYAEKQGLYLLSFSGDVMVLKNREGFVPKMWKHKR